jgi:hypothetical protein
MIDIRWGIYEYFSDASRGYVTDREAGDGVVGLDGGD